MKLLQIAQPERAYFGEKDWQQLTLVRGMAKALFLPSAIVGCHDCSRNRWVGPQLAESASFACRQVSSPFVLQSFDEREGGR